MANLSDKLGDDKQGGWRVVCLALAAGALGYALQRRDGLFEEVAFIFLGISLVCCLLLFVPIRLGAGRWVAIGIWVLIALQFWQMLAANKPGSWHGPSAGRTYYIFLTVLASCAGAMTWASMAGYGGLTRLVFFPLCLLTFLAMGLWWVHSVPHPFIDVWEAQRAGLEAFCAGKSPYNAPFPDIYNYPPGYSPGTVVRNGMVELGFPYPPLSLLLEIPGHVVFGDFRYANVFYVTIAGAAIGYSRRGAISMLGAVLFLTTPRTLFMLEDGFTELQVSMLLAVMIFAACRGWRVTAVLLGLLIAGKQYLIIAAPCAVLMMPRPWNWRAVLRWVGMGILAGLVVSLPIILSDPKGFVRCTITPIMNAYFRYDALSYLALYANRTGVTPGASIGFVLAVVFIPLTIWRMPRSPAGFAMALAVVFMMFFAFSKGAFVNYYYLIIAAFCAGISAQDGVGIVEGKRRYDSEEASVKHQPCPTH